MYCGLVPFSLSLSLDCFFFYFQHVVFSVGRLIDILVPDVPEDVQIKIKREHYMAKEALAENQVCL